MFKGTAIALLVLLGADQVGNRGQVTDTALTMLKQSHARTGFEIQPPGGPGSWTGFSYWNGNFAQSAN